MSFVFQVFGCAAKNFRVIFKVSNTMIATTAQNTSNFTRCMIVIHGCRIMRPTPWEHVILAYKALTILFLPHLVKISRGHIVSF